mmetsp:Transcript_14858/g.34174  ORF Transcript_14858/g.34174 Transcript_14858/m.34174 type:complete len:81 (-) Transcript_14858:15-257(-)
MPRERRQFIQMCTLNSDAPPTGADLEKIASTKNTGLLRQGQRIVLLRQNDAGIQDHEMLEFMGDNVFEMLVACILHNRIY